MLERLGAGDAAALGDVPHDEHRGAALLGEAHQPRGALAHLPHVARRALEVAGEDGLDGIDDHHGRAPVRRGGEDRLEQRLAEQLDVAGTPAEPVGAQLHLQRRFLAGHVQRAHVGRLELRRDLQQDRGLADPRLAADQHHRARHDAAAEHEVELGEAGAQPVISRCRPRRECAASPSDRAAAAERIHAGLASRLPLA